MRRLRGLGAPAACGAALALVLVRSDPAQDSRPAVLLLAAGASYGLLVAALLRGLARGALARAAAGLFLGPLPLALGLPFWAEPTRGERAALLLATALLGLVVGLLEGAPRGRGGDPPGDPRG